VIVLSPLAFLVCVALLARLVLVVARRKTTMRAALVGVLWPWLCAAPAVLVQTATLGEDGLKSPLFFTIGWLIGVGGHSVTLVFEATVGDRHSTLADNFDLYLWYWLVQLALYTVLGMLRFRVTGRLREKWMLVLGSFVLVNALLNISWPWWGT
jgi:hypothetical protein